MKKRHDNISTDMYKYITTTNEYVNTNLQNDIMNPNIFFI